jgi:DNA-binding MarR family transcriptional regulator
MTTTTIEAALQTARKAKITRISDLLALIHLAGVKHATASTIAAEAGVSCAAATQLIDRLAERGFVNRHHDTHDRRLVLSAITTAGRELITPFLP